MSIRDLTADTIALGARVHKAGQPDTVGEFYGHTNIPGLVWVWFDGDLEPAPTSVDDVEVTS